VASSEWRQGAGLLPVRSNVGEQSLIAWPDRCSRFLGELASHRPDEPLALGLTSPTSCATSERRRRRHSLIGSLCAPLRARGGSLCALVRVRLTDTHLRIRLSPSLSLSLSLSLSISFTARYVPRAAFDGPDSLYRVATTASNSDAIEFTIPAITSVGKGLRTRRVVRAAGSCVPHLHPCTEKGRERERERERERGRARDRRRMHKCIYAPPADVASRVLATDVACPPRVTRCRDESTRYKSVGDASSGATTRRLLNSLMNRYSRHF